jgi:hypothetical protein
VDQQLYDTLYRIVSNAVDESPSAGDEAYRSCMASSGYKTESRESLVDQFRPMAATVQSTGTSYQEHQAAAADVRCRRPGHISVMRILDHDLTAFAQHNAIRLGELSLRPDKLQREAKKAAKALDLAVKWI